MRILTVIVALVALLSVNYVNADTDSTAVESFSDAYRAYQSAMEQQQAEDAVHYAKQALALASKETLSDADNYYALHYNLGNALRAADNLTAAIDQFETLQNWSEAQFGEYALETFALRTEVVAIKNTGKYAHSSASKLRDQLRSYKSLLNDLDDAKEENPAEAAAIYYSVLSLVSKSSKSPVRLSKLTKLLEEGIELAEAQWPDNDYRGLHLQVLLAKVHYASDDLDDAVALFSNVAERVDSALSYTHPWVLNAHASLVKAYSRMGEDELATQHCQLIGKMVPWDNEQDPTPIYRVNPDFPVAAARMGSEGYVRFEFDIDEQGFVVNPQVLANSGSSQFIEESLKAIEQWRYAPKFENGEPVLAQHNVVQLDFKLMP
ncbi:TonB family protein [Alteromonas gilva]|uniref:TonB family protein n=1 Tax=Alteromonas gilva TaxID=2987522 RepID=A0ABT5L0P9_9ALTE|nr:TonB family protein [Alteromonas gilva]MDC8830004.1 TonB family protein [Alteromonas gilva]